VMDSETAREAGKRWLDAPRAQPAR